jgi:hypothetical protein
MIRALLLALLLVLSSSRNLNSKQSVTSTAPNKVEPAISARVRTYRAQPKPRAQRDVYVLKRRILRCDCLGTRPVAESPSSKTLS